MRERKKDEKEREIKRECVWLLHLERSKNEYKDSINQIKTHPKTGESREEFRTLWFVGFKKKKKSELNLLPDFR